MGAKGHAKRRGIRNSMRFSGSVFICSDVIPAFDDSRVALYVTGSQSSRARLFAEFGPSGDSRLSLSSSFSPCAFGCP